MQHGCHDDYTILVVLLHITNITYERKEDRNNWCNKTHQYRFVPIASSSSMKIIAGFLSLAKANASLTSLAPSPINICTSWGPANFRNVDCNEEMNLTRFAMVIILQQNLTLVCEAQALASNVFPVPGGPYMRTPFGGCIPMLTNLSLCVIGKTTASISCNRTQW